MLKTRSNVLDIQTVMKDHPYYQKFVLLLMLVSFPRALKIVIDNDI